jgi:hypothetical protein
LLDIIEFRPLVEMSDEEWASLGERIKAAFKRHEEATGRPVWVELF